MARSDFVDWRLEELLGQSWVSITGVSLGLRLFIPHAPTPWFGKRPMIDYATRSLEDNDFNSAQSGPRNVTQQTKFFIYQPSKNPPHLTSHCQVHGSFCYHGS